MSEHETPFSKVRLEMLCDGIFCVAMTLLALELKVPELPKHPGSEAIWDALGELGGDKLSRVPRGFAKDHPAAGFLKYKHFVAGAEFPAAFATDPKFYKTLLAVFRQVTPLARFLNTPLLKAE